MAIIEQSTFNTGLYKSFTPSVTREHNSNLFSGLLIAVITVTVCLIVYYEVTKHMEAKRKNISSAVNQT